MDERRDSRREPGRGPAMVFYGNKRQRCHVVNLSVSGMALRSSSEAKPDSFLRIHYLPAGQDERASVDAVLVRRRQVGAEYEWGVALLSHFLADGARDIGSIPDQRRDVPGVSDASRRGGGLIDSRQAQEMLEELSVRTDLVLSKGANGQPSRRRSLDEWWLQSRTRGSEPGSRGGGQLRKWWLELPEDDDAARWD